MKRGRRKGGSKDKVFGCDLMEHLTATSQEIPRVLQSCSEFIEKHGIVDGIYRLSGVSSNTQKLRTEFDTEATPDLCKDVYLQDIHCVSSLCKAYFRELPNPLLTYQLYDHFAEAVAVQLEDERLVKIKDVLKELPTPHFRTLEYLMRHLVKMATYSNQTNMHARNLAIVWAPNLLRSKDIEASGFNGTAAFMEVRVQSIVVEFILTHVTQLFPEKDPETERRKSLPSPSIQSGQDEFFKASHFVCPGNMSPGDGPPAMRSYHAIIDGTDKRKGSLKGRKWKSIFNLGARLHDPRKKNKYAPKDKGKTALRPAKSMDSLSSGPYVPEDSQQPSTHLSSLPTPSGNTEGTTSGSGSVASGYAVTYRRTGGASVSVVSGGSGAHGTYKSLDAGGMGGTDKLQAAAQGPSSKAERRAGMHISGPFSVTVPLHITSGLALGVLQGKKSEEEQLTSQASEDDQVKKVNKECSEEKESEVEAKSEQPEKENEDLDGDGDGEEKFESMAVKDENIMKCEERDDTGPEDEDLELLSEDEEPESHAAAVLSLSDDRDGGDYMVMRPTMLPCPVELTPQSHEEKNPDQELPLDFQDTFGFLDLMDIPVSNQINEFSVEPPAFEDEEDEEDDKQISPQCYPIYPSPSQSDMITPLLNLPANSHRLLPGKSHSLPYKVCPFLPDLSSSDEDSADIDYSGADDEDDSLSDKSEYEDMFCKSLPPGSDFHGLNWSCPPTPSHDQPEGSSLINTIEIQEHVPDLSLGNQAEISETHMNTEIKVTGERDVCVIDLNEMDLSPLPLNTEHSLGTEHLDKKEDEDKSAEGGEMIGSLEVAIVNVPIEEKKEGLESTDSNEDAATCSQEETFPMECETPENSHVDPDTTSISVELNTTALPCMSDQSPLTEEHPTLDGHQEFPEVCNDVTESEDIPMNALDCVLVVTHDNVMTETDLQDQTDSSELVEAPCGLEEMKGDDRKTGEEMNEEGSEGERSEGEMDEEGLCEEAEVNNEKEEKVDAQKDETSSGRKDEDEKDISSEKQKEDGNTGEESSGELEVDGVTVEIEVTDNTEGGTEIKEESFPEAIEEKASENEEDGFSENEKPDVVTVHSEEKQSEQEEKHEAMSNNQKPERPPPAKKIEPAVERSVVISKNTLPKVYQVKSVPLVPPKPQHSKITAFKQQFHRDTEKQYISLQHFKRGLAKKEKETEHQEHEEGEIRNVERNDKQPTEQDKGRAENRDVYEKNQLKETKACQRFGDERQEDTKDPGQRRGTWDGGSQRRDAQKDLDREAKRSSGISMCFDEAVARATGKLCKEKETIEKDRFIDLHWERGEQKEEGDQTKTEEEVKTD